MVQQVSRDLAGKVAVVQVNTQENPGLAARFTIRGIPALVLLRGGTVIDGISGAMGRDALLAWCRRHVG